MDPLDDLTLFRVYEPHELGDDGYPLVWHQLSVNPFGVKDIVREAAGERCVRCRHPYVVGESGTLEVAGRPSQAPAEVAEQFAIWADEAAIEAETAQKGIHWSSCDEQCTHGGPIRWRSAITGHWHERDDDVSVAQVEFMLKEVDVVDAAWRILTVHHLNGRKPDLRWWNLVALCQRCHLTIQRKVLMERIWPWEHSDWFKPHAAAWYAYAYRGENLTRSQTLERLDELLSLERVA